MPKDSKTQIIRDAVRRLQHLPSRTIARNVLLTHGEEFNNDLELIRQRVRRIRGRHGEQDRKYTADKSLYITDDTQLKMPKTWRKVRTPYKLPMGLWLVLSDFHVPFHEPVPIEAAVQYGQTQKVSGLFINGDLQDCSEIGIWYKEKRAFEEEMYKVIDMLDWLRLQFPKIPFVYKPGNHEFRLPRYYVTQAPALMETPLAAMETLLGFEERGIEFLDYHQKVYAGELPVIHGHEVQHLQTMVNPARGLFLKTKTYSACSHCHRTSEHSTRDINETILTTWSFGCLCDLSPDYNPIGNEWNWGFALVNIEDRGFFEVENRRILPNGKVV